MQTFCASMATTLPNSAAPDGGNFEIFASLLQDLPQSEFEEFIGRLENGLASLTLRLGYVLNTRVRRTGILRSVRVTRPETADKYSPSYLGAELVPTLCHTLIEALRLDGNTQYGYFLRLVPHDENLPNRQHGVVAYHFAGKGVVVCHRWPGC
jgi:hypothetical protein